MRKRRDQESKKKAVFILSVRQAVTGARRGVVITCLLPGVERGRHMSVTRACRRHRKALQPKVQLDSRHDPGHAIWSGHENSACDACSSIKLCDSDAASARKRGKQNASLDCLPPSCSNACLPGKIETIGQALRRPSPPKNQIWTGGNA